MSTNPWPACFEARRQAMLGPADAGFAFAVLHHSQMVEAYAYAMSTDNTDTGLAAAAPVAMTAAAQSLLAFSDDLGGTDYLKSQLSMTDEDVAELVGWANGDPPTT